MLQGTLCIQCTATTGEVGDFLVPYGQSWRDAAPITPVTKTAPELFTWLRENGWKQGVRCGIDRLAPLGTYVKDDDKSPVNLPTCGADTTCI